MKSFFMKTMFLALFLTGCAGHIPVPGSSEAVNPAFYSTEQDLLERLGQLKPGMTESEVFAKLGHSGEDLMRLERSQVVTALYGSSAVEFHDGSDQPEEDSRFLQSLYGYRLEYKIIKREHGFSSPIRIRTDEKGFDYAVTLIFREGALYEKPILTGGVVNRSSSKTFFDYLNPGTIIDRTAN